MAEQILIEFLADASKLVPAIDILRKAGQISEEDEKALAAMAAAYNKAFDTGNKAAAATIPTLQKVEDAVVATSNAVEQALAAEFKKLATESSKTVKSLSNVEKALQDGVTDALDEAGVSAQQFEKALTEAGISTEEFSGMLVNAAAGSKEFTDAVDNADKKSLSLKGQLRQLKEQMSQLEQAGQEDSQAFMEMAVQAAQLEDQVGDTQARIRAMASDTANTDAAVQGIQALASGFQLVTGAQELFGSGSEDVQKAIAKLNAIMAITTGIQQLQQSLQKETILVQKLGIIQTKAAAAAQLLWNFVIGGTSVLLKVLKGALVATGIGAIIVLLGYAADAMGFFGDSTDEAADKLKKEKEAADAAAEAIENLTKANIKANNSLAGGTDVMTRQIALLKAKGASDTLIYTREQQLRKKELEDINTLFLATFDNKEKRQKLAEEIANKSNEIEVARSEFERKSTEKSIENAKKAGEKRKEIDEKSAKARYEIVKRGLDAEVELLASIVNGDDTANDIKLAFLSRYLDSRLAVINAGEEEELANSKLTEDERLNIQDKYAKERLKAQQEFGHQKNAIAKSQAAQDIEDEKKSLEDLQAAISTKYTELASVKEKLFSEMATGNAGEKDQILTLLEAQYKSGLISLKTYEKEREKVQQEFAAREVNNEIARVEALVAIRKAELESKKANPGVTAKELEELNAAIDALDNSLYAAKEQKRQLDLKRTKDVSEKQVDILRESLSLAKNYIDSTIGDSSAGKILNTALNLYDQLEQLRQSDLSNEEKHQAAKKAVVTTALAAAGEAVNAYFANQAANRQAELNSAIEGLNTQKEAELSAKNITEQQKDDINRRYAAKERKLKLQAFEEDKKAKKAQAIIAGALAIVQAFAQLGPIGGAIAAVGIIAATAIQVNSINKQKPGFKKGTRNAPKGYAWVGEEGPEIVQLKGGEKIYTYSQSKKVAAGWESNASRTPDEILGGFSMPEPVPAEVLNYSSNSTAPEIDYEKLAQAMAKYIPQPSLVQNNMDADGFTTYVINGLSKAEIKNKRHQT